MKRFELNEEDQHREHVSNIVKADYLAACLIKLISPIHVDQDQEETKQQLTVLLFMCTPFLFFFKKNSEGFKQSLETALEILQKMLGENLDEKLKEQIDSHTNMISQVMEKNENN